MATRLATKRLMKEMADINTNGCPPGIAVLEMSTTETWSFTIQVLGDETVYRGETFAMKMVFPNRYPMEYPAVTFLNDSQYKPPIHPHVYSNGHICASIFGNDWSPVNTAMTICISIQSMLASCNTKERPPGDERYSRSAPSDPKQTRWAYHDDNI